MARNLLLPVTRIEQGQKFTYHGYAYRRATEKEEHRHPARELQLRRPELVLAYMMGRAPTPVSFAPSCRVLIALKRRGT